jgi:hypothetical protein
MTNKTKYEKPKLLKLGYDDEVAVGACDVGNGVKTTCNPNGNKADACGPGGIYMPCTNGQAPVS